MIRGLAVIVGATALCFVVKRLVRRGWMGFAVPFAVVLIGAALYLNYIGYLGGPVLTVIRPTADQSAPPYAAVLLSGDMGVNAGMGKAVIAHFATDGVPVVAVNTLRAFRTTQTPAQAAALVVDAVHRARALAPSGRVVLIGQSFGADMLQVAVASLAPADRHGIAAIALVVPGDTLDFRASPSELFAFGESLVDALPTARRLGWVPTFCIWGVEETDSLCPKLDNPAVQVIGLPGGHPLRRDSDRVYAELKNAFAHAIPR